MKHPSTLVPGRDLCSLGSCANCFCRHRNGPFWLRLLLQAYNKKMLTPYDWQEGIGHRAAYIEGRLVEGSPILAVSLEEGVLIFSYRRHARKIYEIYDRLAYTAIGQQSDVEALRMAALDFAHQEGFNRSERDVTIRRVVSALSAPMKRAFADFSSPPFVARSLFAEVCRTMDADTFSILDFDGDFRMRKLFAYVAGTDEHGEKLKAELGEIQAKGLKAEAAHKRLRDLWDETFIVERPEGFMPEAVLVSRDETRDNRFVLLTPDEA